MKRCPECGYRVKAELKRCPLCDGRMVEDPSGQTARIQTHVHQEKEACILPNRTEEEAARKRYRAVMEKQLRDAREKPAVFGRGRGQDAGKKVVGFVVVLLLYILLEACGA